MWFIFQAIVIFAVMASNIRWHWTPNGYAAGLLTARLACGAAADRWIERIGRPARRWGAWRCQT
jgi:hypothetical protein